MKNISIKQITYISIVTHLICSIFSTGFHHFDEHFQIYEFLNLKLGEIPSSNLPWEFREKIRPWFQVYIYYIFQKIFSFFGVSSPFVFSFVFRVLTSMLGVFALTRMIPLLRIWFKTEKIQKLAWAFVNLSWFVPYIQTRTSSESFGISFFIWGISSFLLVKEKSLLRDSFFAGILFGLSYLSRSQMAFPIAFLWFWGILIGRKDKKILGASALAIVIMIFSGILFDRWGYGEWTFSTWHYFRTNFIEGIMSSVKQYPWYWYFRLSLFRGIPPIGLPLIIATLWGIVKMRRHPLTWSILPLFLFHSYIGHKELRYIFPVIIFTPLYLAFFYQHYQEKIDSLLTKKRWRGLLKFVVGVNVLLLVMSIFRPANPAPNFYKYVYNEKIQTIFINVENPYTMLGLPIEYYKRKNLKLEKYEKFEDLLSTSKKPFHVFFNKGKHILKMEKDKRCRAVYMAYPRWSLNFNVGNWISRSRVWSLYRCL